MTSEEELGFLKNCSQVEACRYLGTRIRRVRSHLRESQEDFAERAQVSLRTYKRFETHGKASLETFIKVLRAVGRTQYLFMLFPAPAPIKVKPILNERLRRLTPTKFL